MPVRRGIMVFDAVSGYAKRNSYQSVSFITATSAAETVFFFFLQIKEKRTQKKREKKYRPIQRRVYLTFWSIEPIHIFFFFFTCRLSQPFSNNILSVLSTFTIEQISPNPFPYITQHCSRYNNKILYNYYTIYHACTIIMIKYRTPSVHKVILLIF